MNQRTKDYIQKIGCIESLNDKELIQLSDELDEYLSTLPEKEQDEFANGGYGESFDMVVSGVIYEKYGLNLLEFKMMRSLSKGELTRTQFVKMLKSSGYTIEMIDKVLEKIDKLNNHETAPK